MAWTTLLATFTLLSLFKDRVRLSGALSFSFFTLIGSIVFETCYVGLSRIIETNPTTVLFLDRSMQVLMNFIFSYVAYHFFDWLDQFFYNENIWSKTPEKNDGLDL
ncbi:MAG: hypothetical protein WA160_08860 [Pseudobdellovibrio sp.]